MNRRIVAQRLPRAGELAAGQAGHARMREALRKQPLLVSEAELLVSLRASLVELAGNAPIRGELANVQRLAHSGVLARHRAAAAVPAVL